MNSVRLTSLATSVLLATSAMAGETASDRQSREDNTRLAACFDSAADGDRNARLTCIGAVYDACEARPAPSDDQYAIGCYLAEARAWEALMNREYALTAAVAEGRDKAAAAPGETESGSLAMSQVAWRDYQMAHCDYAYAKWGDGEMRMMDSAKCARDMFAARTIFLWQERQPLPWPEDVGWHAR